MNIWGLLANMRSALCILLFKSLMQLFKITAGDERDKQGMRSTWIDSEGTIRYLTTG